MGLFGGFKGKLIGKEKKTKEGKNQVVCVKFSTFSEFDDAIPSCSNQNPGPNEVIRERRRPTKPEVKSVFGRMPNGDVKEHANGLNAAKSLDGGINATKFSMEEIYGIDTALSANAAKSPDRQIKATNFSREEIYGINATPPAAKSTTKEKDLAKDTNAAKLPAKNSKKAKKAEAAKPPAKTSKKVAEAPSKSTNAPTSPTKASDGIKSTAPAKNEAKSTEIAKSSTSVEEEAAKSPPPIFLKLSTPAVKSQAPKPPPTKKSPVEAPKYEAPTPIVTQTLKFPLQESDSEDDGNFKIHFAQKVNPNFADLSDEDDWGGDNDDLSPINYSSHATNIFFGGDEEPMVMRPRQLKMNNDDDHLSDGSSASA